MRNEQIVLQAKKGTKIGLTFDSNCEHAGAMPIRLIKCVTCDIMNTNIECLSIFIYAKAVYRLDTDIVCSIRTVVGYIGSWLTIRCWEGEIGAI